MFFQWKEFKIIETTIDARCPSYLYKHLNYCKHSYRDRLRNNLHKFSWLNCLRRNTLTNKQTENFQETISNCWRMIRFMKVSFRKVFRKFSISLYIPAYIKKHISYIPHISYIYILWSNSHHNPCCNLLILHNFFW